MRRDSSRYGNFPKRQKSRERPWNRASPAFGKLWEHAGKCRVDLKEIFVKRRVNMAEKLRPLDQVEMGRRVRSRREAIGLSRENLAEQLDVSAQFIADIEYGHKGISIKKLYLLCQILNVTADYILAGGILPEEMDGETSRACEEIMAILHQCDARQLRSIGKIAQIYADEVRMK